MLANGLARDGGGGGARSNANGQACFVCARGEEHRVGRGFEGPLKFEVPSRRPVEAQLLAWALKFNFEGSSRDELL